ncbi:MAG TPA: DUF5678 domain-containing protein [Bryobacteraceae bacterium]|nr:DUF5678 domain-containing protein [Bryobacteraceae bacterium]
MSIQLAPEIEAGLRAEAAALGISIDALIANAVKAYLGSGTLSTAHSVPSRDRSAEVKWASRPDAQFVGKWVVLEGNRVITSGSDPKHLYEEARAKGNSSPFLIFVADDHEPFVGGWVD